MKHSITHLRDAALYARTDHQQLVREILRCEGIKHVEHLASSM